MKIELMSYIFRNIQTVIEGLLEKGRNILLLGPRQTGKTTLLARIKADLTISFIQPRVRLRYEQDPSVLADEIEALQEDSQGRKPLVIVDEVQKVPLIMDVVQDLIDRQVAQFILTGSSVRKLKRGSHVNLLPGRVIPLTMDPLALDEIPKNHLVLEDLLLFGSLPAVINAQTLDDKEQLLDAYVTTYLEEEIRAEAIVRNVGHFARFLELAASESGCTVNFSKLAQVVGVAHSTIMDYYQILEDCLVVKRIEPITESKTRHRLGKTQKYLLFDLGLRRLAAREGQRLPRKQMGHLFEQFVGLELLKQADCHLQRIAIRCWRDLSGPEVDWVIDAPGQLIPIEVKYTDKPRLNDAKHLQVFLAEYEQAERAYIVCQTPRKMKLADNIYAIPWQSMDDCFTA